MAVLIYLGIVIVFYFLQKKVIFPGAVTQGLRESIYHPNPDEELITLKSDDDQTIVALFGTALLSTGKPRPDADRCPTLLYFYGNGMSVVDSAPQFDRFRRLGLNVMIPDFEGYGMSSGSPSEAGCYATGDTALGYLLRRPGIDPKKLIIAGWSLGAATAIEIASRKPVAALITFSAFTSMNDMARLTFPWLPTSLILRHHFYNLRKIPEITCPIMIVHGTADSWSPSICPPA